MATIEELREEYDRLSDQGRDTYDITAAIEAIFNTPNEKLSSVYPLTTNIVRKLQHVRKVQNRSFEHMGLMELFSLREKFVKTHSWAIPTREVVDAIRVKLKELKVNTILDVGCGKALWPALINQYGCFNVTAFDVEKIDAPYMEVTNTYPMAEFDCLLYVWPDYAEPWAYNELFCRTPKVVVYVGEERGGCTADDNFYELLRTDYTRVHHSYLPNWPSIHDTVNIYCRRYE